MKPARLFLVFFLSLLTFAPVRADEVRNLYEAETPVVNQGAEERQRALAVTFEQVLAKVSGFGAVAAEPALAEALVTPEQYVQQFLYREPQPGQLNFWARFDQAAVNALLRKQQLPVWGAVRPATLMWLAVEERGERRLVGANEQGEVAVAVTAQADRRGLPLHLPLLDLQDLARIQPSDVWGDFRDVIQSASARYNAQAVLAAALLRDGDRYRARFTLYQNELALRWEQAGSLDEVMAAGVGRATDEIAAAYTQAVVSASDVTVQVSGVQSLRDYVRAMAYLDGLSGVSHVELVLVQGDHAVYRLTLQGAAQALVQAIALGDTLSPDPAPGLLPAQAELSYRLLK
ncbi:MAG: DUF2066 domain-containing protein [Gammaproteobacteria bacterium]|nr:DUF2066 domain-containing protein [Gammaproteobacteria bacterium]